MEIRAFQDADESGVIELWGQCDLLRPQNDPHTDIRRKLAVGPDLFLVGVLGNEIVATVMAGYEGHRGWINYLAVSPPLQKQGYGHQIMEHAEKLLRARGCPKINLQVRTSNVQVIEFYRSLGFATDDVMSLGKRLVIDQPQQPQR
ncbi:MAG: GCN5-related N-acetyltransferase [Verrucomicrobiaceae bacterium]|nr:GCN5-related N-acetyltransferase [Verrucomicrobiaceae bacterium]